MKINILSVINFVILICAVYLLFTKSCNNDQKEIIKKEVVVKRSVDTLIQVKVDTVIKTVFLEVPTPTPIDSNLNLYTQVYSDSLLDAEFNTKVDGVMVSSQFDYRLKVPKEITKTIKITDSVIVNNTIKANKSFLALNLLGLYNNNLTMNQFDLGIGLSYYNKNGYIYQINYLPINKSIVGGISYQFK